MLNEEDELQCLTCHSTFVEKTGQGIESFLDDSISIVSATENREQDRINNSRSGDTPAPSLANTANLETLHVARNESVRGSNVQSASRRLSGSEQIFDTLLRFLVPSGGVESNVLNIPDIVPITILNSEDGNPFVRSGSLTNFNDILHHILMHETSHKNVPTTPEAIAHFTQSYRIHNQEELIQHCSKEETVNGESVIQIESCPITQEPFRVEDTVRVISCCRSVFQEDSLLSWLNIHSTCPVCRKKLIVE